MWKYLKQLFHEVVVQSKQLVGRNMERVNHEDTENERGCSRRESQRRSDDDEKSLARDENLKKQRDDGVNTARRKKRYCCAKRHCRRESGRERDSAADGEMRNEAQESRVSGKICRCENCGIVSSLNECAVCLESLQNRGVKSCAVCANIVCATCSEKLKSCPFCRSTRPMEKNRAIERLLDGLYLPCRNSRNGCREMLNSDTRSKHEAVCNYTLIDCPVSKACCWNGAPGTILNHLKKAHGLKPLEDRSLTVEISSFRRETMSREGEYTIYLSCYGQLFAVKVTLRRKKLAFSFTRMGYTSGKWREINCENKKYDVWVKIKVGDKYMKGVVPFDKLDAKTKKIEINCKSLRSASEDNAHPDKDDNLKIQISIKECKEEKQLR